MITKDKKLHIRFKFENFEFIVATKEGKLYQLPHFSNKRTKVFREINKIKVGGSLGYRINRKFITHSKLKSISYKVDEYYTYEKEVIYPF